MSEILNLPASGAEPRMGEPERLGSQTDTLDMCTHAQGTANGLVKAWKHIRMRQNTPKLLEEIMLTSGAKWMHWTCAHTHRALQTTREKYIKRIRTPQSDWKKLYSPGTTSAKLRVEEPHRLWNHVDVSDIRTHAQSIRINAKMTAKNMKMSANL